METRSISPWQLAWRYRYLLVLGTLTGMGLGAALFHRLPVVYQSEAQVLVWQKRPNAIASVEARVSSVEDSLATHQELLKSARILDGALRGSGLDSAATFRNQSETPVELLRKQLLVSRARTTGQNNVLQVSLRGKVAEDCPLLLAAVLDSYKHFLDSKYLAYTGDALERLLRQRADLKEELAREESAYRNFLEHGPVLMKKSDGTDLRRERLTVLQSKRSQLSLRRLELGSELDSIEAAQKLGDRQTVLALIAEFAHRGDETDAARGNAGASVSMSDQLTPLLLEERKLLERYGSSHPEVQSVRQRIVIARRHLVLPASAWEHPSSAADSTPSAKRDYRVAFTNGQTPEGKRRDPVVLHVQILQQKLDHVRRSEERLNRLFHDEQHEARRQAGAEIQDDAFRNRIKQARQDYESLSKRFQDVSLVNGVGGYDVEVVSPPSPGRKVAPSLLLLLPAGALLGALAAMGFAYLRFNVRVASNSSGPNAPPDSAAKEIVPPDHRDP